MAPDYGKPAVDIAGSVLFNAIAPKLAEYIHPDELYHQLALAYYTYPRRRFDLNENDLGAAFTWADTCQGDDFWRALTCLCDENIDGALEALQELIDVDD